jgi:hypothetical protein
VPFVGLMRAPYGLALFESLVLVSISCIQTYSVLEIATVILSCRLASVDLLSHANISSFLHFARTNLNPFPRLVD